MRRVVQRGFMQSFIDLTSFVTGGNTNHYTNACKLLKELTKLPMSSKLMMESYRPRGKSGLLRLEQPHMIFNFALVVHDFQMARDRRIGSHEVPKHHESTLALLHHLTICENKCV